MDSSILAKSLKTLLKEKGHEMSLGHVYELLSKLSGHPSWNVCKTKGEFQPLLSSIRPQAVGVGNFKVVITSDVQDEGGFSNIELRKDYLVTAADEAEAQKIVSSYLAYRADDERLDLLEIPGVQNLLNAEDEDQFKKSNWEVIWNDSKPSVREAYSMTPTPKSKKISTKEDTKVFTITALNPQAISDISSIADSVIMQCMKNQETEIPKKFIESSAALGSSKVLNSRGDLILNFSQLTSVLDTFGGFYSSLLKASKTLPGDYGSSIFEAESLFQVVQEAKLEAEKQGYIYPHKNPVFGLLKNDPQ